MRRRRILRSAVLAAGTVLALLLVGLIVLTNTDWGRERVGGYVLGVAEGAIRGELTVGRVEGNLLDRIRLVDVRLVDEEGRPFVRADTVVLRLALLPLVRRRIDIRDVRIARSEVVVDRPPGEDWNFTRILPIDPAPDRPASRRRWGDWIDFHDVELVDSRVTVRTEWEAGDDLTAEEQRVALERALSSESRENVVPVPGGHQNVMDFRQLDVRLSRLLVSHPDSAATVFDVASLSGVLQPFEPPPAIVQEMSGRFRLLNDSLYMVDVEARLPQSLFTGEGVYALESGDLLLRLEGAPAGLADLRWLRPTLPTEGGGPMRIELRRTSLASRAVITDADVRVGESRVRGKVDVTLGDTLRLQDTDLRFERVDTRLIESAFPEVEVPRHGHLNGHAILTGTPRAMDVDADVTFDDAEGGVSRAVAEGEIGVNGDVRFSDLSLRLSPLQADLVRALEPGAEPLRGTIEGTARLTGVWGDLRLDSDLTLRDPVTGVSRVIAEGGVGWTERLRLRDMALRFDPLRADLVRHFVPDAPLQGTIEGTARLTGLWGDLEVDGDLTLRDPVAGVSRVLAEGGIDWTDRLRLTDMALRFDPLRAELVRRIAPDAPFQGTLLGSARLSGFWDGLLQVDADLTIDDPRGGPSRVSAEGGVDRRGELRLVDLDVEMDPLHLNILRDELTHLPEGATMAGRVRLNGEPATLLDVDGDVTVSDPATGVSRIGARGGIGTADGIRFRDLAVTMQPLNLALLPRIGAPESPVGGTLEGSAVLDGDPRGTVAFDADVVHREAGERSHVLGSGEVVAGPEGRVALDLAVQPLSLVTAGRFVPDAGLQGSVRGNLVIQGVKRALEVRADLDLPDGGGLIARGSLDVASEEVGYDLALTLSRVDLAAVSTRAPAETNLTGDVLAAGRGLEPATMNARISADLSGVRVDETSADEVRLRLELAGGLATVDSSVVRLETAEAVLDGSFGLVADRHGVLGYDVRMDSLHALAPWIPGADTAVVVLRPAVQSAVEEEERAARARALRSARVESLATGRPIPVELLDTLSARPAGIPRDSVSGRVHATGELRGNVERFDVQGAAELEEVVFQGNYVGRGQVAYDVIGAGAPAADVAIEATLESVLTQGFAYDSASVEARYSGGRLGSGELQILAFQDAYTDVQADVRFTLAEERSELYLEDVAIRMDTVTWRNTQVGVVGWGGDGIEVDALDLRSDAGGRLFVDGRVPSDGPADFRVVAENLRIEHVEALVQAQLDASGRLDLDARVTGLRSDPVIVGTAALIDGAVGDTRIEDARGTFNYQNRELTGEFEVWQEERRLARADVRLPVNLALEGVTGSRLLDAPLFVDVQADSLPIGAISVLTPGLEDVQGALRGDFRILGTFDDPLLEGAVDLDAGSVRVEALGVAFSDIGGRLRLDGNRLVIDSLVALGAGSIHVVGGIDLSDLRAPELEMTVEASEARVVDNDMGRLVVDATLQLRGPLDDVAVTGLVRTRRGVIHIPELSELGATQVVALDEPATFERVDTLLAARRDLLIERHPILSRLDVDVDVSVDRDVWLRSLEANVEIYTPPEIGPMRVQLAGAERRLVLEGTINTDRGEYEFMSRPFQLTRGAVTFRGDPDLDAIVQVAAEHEVQLPGRQAFAIRVLIAGTLREPTVTFESSAQPPISQTDLLTYIAFGRRGASVLPVQASALSGQSAASGDLVGNMAALATQQLTSAAVGTVLNELEGEAAQELGLDVFRITPADFPDELFAGGFNDLLRGTEIEIGSYVTPRLFASAAARGDFVRAGMTLEYLTPSGFRWRTTWVPRYLPSEPTLAEQSLETARVFGLLLRREWRF